MGMGREDVGAAIKYCVPGILENNPVTAGLVNAAADWPWSSARSHIAGRRSADDPLTDVATLGRHVRNWRAMLRHGLEAADIGDAQAALVAAIETRLRTGRPLGAQEWIARQEAALDRPLAPQKRGPKAKRTTTDR